MDLIASILFVLLWCVVATLIIVPFARAYFPERGRAEGLVAVLVLGFAGATFAKSGGSSAPQAQPSQSPIVFETGPPLHPAPVATPQTMIVLRDSSRECEKVSLSSANGHGSLDVLYAESAGPESGIGDGAELARSEVYDLTGWASNLSMNGASEGVCAVIDGRIASKATIYYGGPRPDVQKAFGRSGLLYTSYVIKLPASAVAPGRHTLRVAEVEPGEVAHFVPGKRDVVVR